VDVAAAVVAAVSCTACCSSSTSGAAHRSQCGPGTDEACLKKTKCSSISTSKFFKVFFLQAGEQDLWPVL